MIDKRNSENAEQKPANKAFNYADIPGSSGGWDCPKTQGNKAVQAQCDRIYYTNAKSYAKRYEWFEPAFAIVFNKILKI